MAQVDTEELPNPADLSLQDILKLGDAQLDKLRLAALAQIAFDPRAPAAARVAALKELGETPKSQQDQGDGDPSSMTLDDINAELAGLT